MNRDYANGVYSAGAIPPLPEPDAKQGIGVDRLADVDRLLVTVLVGGGVAGVRRGQRANGAGRLPRPCRRTVRRGNRSNMDVRGDRNRNKFVGWSP